MAGEGERGRGEGVGGDVRKGELEDRGQCEPPAGLVIIPQDGASLYCYSTPMYDATANMCACIA